MSIDQPSFENLLRHDGEAFVRAAYERLLRRSPSADEVRSWLVRLCDGSLTKREVLTAIRASPEGRAQAIALPGLVSSRFAMLIRRAPVIGYAVRWLEQAARLPRTAQRMSACETAIAVLRDEQAAIAHAVCKLDASAQANQAATAVFRDEQATLARAVCKLEATAQANQEATAEIKDTVAALRAATDANQVATGGVKNALAALDAALRKAALLPPEIDERQALDAYYRRFEDRFRGSADEIRARLEFYIPILVAQAAPARYLDVGCGRGELLELARHHGLHMAGVDASEAMVAQCQERGLEAVLGDGVEHLAAIDRGSLAGVTAIHVIEHLPFRTLARFVASAFRALRPGGVLVCETPNPENLIVGACNFYYDPTHVRPLPPEPVRYLLESAGFEHVAIERLHAGATPEDVAHATDDVSRLYTSIMLVPQDYAVIGYKPLEAGP